MKKLITAYYSLPVTSSPAEFLTGLGNWGLSATEYRKAVRLAKQICQR